MSDNATIALAIIGTAAALICILCLIFAAHYRESERVARFTTISFAWLFYVLSISMLIVGGITADSHGDHATVMIRKLSAWAAFLLIGLFIVTVKVVKNTAKR